MSWLTELKAGDKVVVRHCCSAGEYYEIARVKNITSKGFINVEGNLYYPQNGIARSRHSCNFLMDYNDKETKKAIKQSSQQKYIRSVFSMIPPRDRITYEQAKQVAEILGIEVEKEDLC